MFASNWTMDEVERMVGFFISCSESASWPLSFSKYYIYLYAVTKGDSELKGSLPPPGNELYMVSNSMMIATSKTKLLNSNLGILIYFQCLAD